MNDTKQTNDENKVGLWLAGGLVLLLAALGMRAMLTEEVAVKLTLEEQYQTHMRLRHLQFNGCNFGRTFDSDTTDMVSVLVSKLDGRGGRDSLEVARTEVAGAGADAIEPLTRLFDEVFSDPYRQGVVQNILGACALMEDDSGLEIMRRGLDHQSDAALLAAVDGLRVRGQPVDYVRLSTRLQMARSAGSRNSLSSAMGYVDLDALLNDLVGWIDRSENVDLYAGLVKKACSATEPQLVAGFLDRRRATGITPVMQCYLIAPSARDGNLATLQELIDSTMEAHTPLARAAVEALGLVGLGHEVQAAFLEHGNARVRYAAAEVLAAHADFASILPTFERGLNDPDGQVRTLVRRTLVRRGHEQAIATCLQDLRASISIRSAAIFDLRQGWNLDSDVPQRALEALQARLEEPASARDRNDLIYSIGFIPLREAALFIMAQAPNLPPTIGQLDAFEWCCGAVYNTGEVGRQVLRELYRTETDPMNRVALIQYIWQDKEPASLEVLLEAFLNEETNPYERLFLADRMIRIGPATRLAPIIKRTYLGITHPVVRPALQCLLWAFYGQHYEDS
jgi:hypothetical protein